MRTFVLSLSVILVAAVSSSSEAQRPAARNAATKPAPQVSARSSVRPPKRAGSEIPMSGTWKLMRGSSGTEPFLRIGTFPGRGFRFDYVRAPEATSYRGSSFFLINGTIERRYGVAHLNPHVNDVMGYDHTQVSADYKLLSNRFEQSSGRGFGRKLNVRESRFRLGDDGRLHVREHHYTMRRQWGLAGSYQIEPRSERVYESVWTRAGGR